MPEDDPKHVLTVDLVTIPRSELERLQAIERRARDEADNAMSEDAVISATYILGED